MNSKDLKEANVIERELWVLRTAIRYHKRAIANGGRPASEVSDNSASI